MRFLQHIIYDIGAHHGDDTAYYLESGYKVIAIDANPRLSKQLEQKFVKAVQTGALTILNVAISDGDQQKIQFYISQDDWRSSVIKNIAERETSILETVEVPTRTLCDLFNEFGTPYYCKIDIEGNDEKAIRSMISHPGRPAYISSEISCRSIAEIHLNNELLFGTLDALRDAGYSQYQLIDQDDLVQLDNSNHYARLQKLRVRLFRKMERVTGFLSPKYNNRLYLARQRKTDPEYVTASFGEALSGPWEDYGTTKKYLQYHFNDYYAHTTNKQLIFWVDIHARQ